MSDWFLTVFFMGALVFPLAATLFQWDPYDPPRENRRLAGFPQLEATRASIEGFPKAFENYVNDHFSPRGAMIRWHNLFKYAVLGVSSSLEKLVIGKNGWFYYGQVYAMRREGFGKSAYAKMEETLIKRRDWLKERGIPYLLVLIPGAYTIYPEHLPDFLTPIQEETRIAETHARLSQIPDLDVLDLTPRLLAEKENQLLFQRYDSHWNDVGAFAAYQEIAARLAQWFPEITPRPISDFAMTTERRRGGYHNNALALPWELYEDYPAIDPIHRHYTEDTQSLPVFFLTGQESPPLPVMLTTMADGEERPSAVVFMDSFGYYQVKFLSEHFSRVLWVRQPPFSCEIIESEKPDVVLSLVFEENINKLERVDQWSISVATKPR